MHSLTTLFALHVLFVFSVIHIAFPDSLSYTFDDHSTEMVQVSPTTSQCSMDTVKISSMTTNGVHSTTPIAKFANGTTTTTSTQKLSNGCTLVRTSSIIRRTEVSATE